MTLVPALKSGTGFVTVPTNTILDSLDGLRKSPLQTLLAASWSGAERAEFGLYLVDVMPPEGQRWSRTFDSVDGLPVALFEPIPARPPHVTRLAFDNRFTAAELVTLELNGLDNPAAPAAQRQLAATLRVSQRKIDRSAFIDLSRADTRMGVQMLESAGLLAPGRALAILDTPVTLEERPL